MDVKKEPPLKRDPSLYTRLGGAPAIGIAVDDFLAGQLAAGKLKEEYRQRGLPEVTRDLKQKLVDQIGAATGGPQQSAGPPLKEAYPDLKVTSAEYNGLVDRLVKALEDSETADKDRKELETKLAGLRDQILSQP
jgi:hemoglobin